MKEKKKSLYTRLLILSYELEGNTILGAIKKGFLMIVPVLFLGAMALVIKSFPIPWFQKFLDELWNGSLKMFLNGIYEATYGFLSIYLTVSISLSYVRKVFKENEFMQGLAVILSVICLTESLGLGREEFSYKAFGNTGVFTAIVIGILAPVIFERMHKLMLKNQSQGMFVSEEIDERLLNAVVLPFMLCILLFFGLNILLYQTSGYSSLNDLFAAFFGAAFKSMGTNLISGLLFLLISGLLWFCGIHGGNALELVSQNIFVPTNTNPNVIMSKSFIDVFGLMGGCGATVCLLIAILLFAKEKNHINLAKGAIPTVLFNVNEIVVFGLPVIFNPIMLIPFVLAPMVSLTIAYAAASLGIMPVPAVMVEWTTPILLSGYIVTKSISGLLVQLAGVVAGVAVYAPFIKLLEKVEKEREQFLIGEMEQDYMNSLEKGEEISYSTAHHGIKRMRVALIQALKKDILDNQIPMQYQPQVDKSGKVIGAEALLRWEYNGRKIFPPLIVLLAKEEGIMDELSLGIMRKSCIDAREMVADNSSFKLSVNMVAEQLDNIEFVRELLGVIDDYGMRELICLEITEETNMDNLPYIIENIRWLKERGIRFAMDDFSMGHTSVKYLQDNLFDYVKLDGVLVKEMMKNPRSEMIVSSIISLGETLNLRIIAEYVDTKEKEEKLIELGCDYLQGYLYSPAVSMPEVRKIAEEKK